MRYTCGSRATDHPGLVADIARDAAAIAPAPRIPTTVLEADELEPYIVGAERAA